MSIPNHFHHKERRDRKEDPETLGDLRAAFIAVNRHGKFHGHKLCPGSLNPRPHGLAPKAQRCIRPGRMRCRSAAEDEAAVLAMGEFARGFRRSRGPVFEAPVQKRHLLLGRHLVQELARRAPPPARRGDRIKRFLFFRGHG